MQPYQVRKVSDSEYTDLYRQGLIHSTLPETYPAPAIAVQATTQEGTK